MSLPEPRPHNATSSRDVGSLSDGHRRVELPHGTMRLPVFLPDATHGVVRSLDASDVEACGIEALQTNAFHIMQRPGSTVVKSMGGLHPLLGWRGPLLPDSGG